MKSYWQETVDKKEYPKLDRDTKTDVVIIGGGMAGIVTAYMLQKAGFGVTILEKNEMGMGVTANTTAKLTSQHGLFYSYLINSFSRCFAKKYLEANENALDLIKEIIEKENIDCDFEKQDNYVYTKVESELAKIKEEVKSLEILDFFGAEFVDKLELPFEVSGAIKFKNQAKFHPLKYLIGILDYLEKTDCNLFENSKVIDVNEKNGYYDVVTDDYKVGCKYVVLTSHYPILNFPGMHFLKMYQDRSYIIAVDTKEKLFDGMYITSESPEISYRVVKDGDKELLLVVGSDHKTGDKAANVESAYVDLENHAKSIYPNSEVVYKWSTEDCISLDKVPYIGEFSKLMPNVFMATGFKKWGMTSSHVAAQIISDKIQGKTNEYEDVFSSTRFEAIENKEELANNVKQVAKSLILSRFTTPEEEFEDIQNDGGGIILYKGQKVGIYKNAEGEIFAVKPYCGHLGCELTWNNLEKSWDCPCHGSRFDYLGNVINEPTKKDLKTVDIEE